jgi:iron complex transport system substrate-binding protein
MLRKTLLVLLLIPLLSACAGGVTPTPGAAPINLVDDLGRTVVLSAPAVSVVSLAPSNTEILFAIGAGAQVVGRDEASDSPAEAASLPTVGGWAGFSTESIIALNPDLVLAQGGGLTSPELIASLQALGLTVYVLPNPATLEAMFANLETVGTLTGHASEARALVESLTSRVAAVDAKVQPLSYAPTVYYEIDATEPTKPYTAGPGSFVDLLIARAGGINIGATLESPWAQISLEQLVVANPAFILLGDAAYGETPSKVAQRPGWEALSAVQTGQVIGFDDNLVSRPGPRLVDGLEALVRILHPGLIP